MFGQESDKDDSLARERALPIGWRLMCGGGAEGKWDGEKSRDEESLIRESPSSLRSPRKEPKGKVSQRATGGGGRALIPP